jgi:hypothetical protein
MRHPRRKLMDGGNGAREHSKGKLRLMEGCAADIDGKTEQPVPNLRRPAGKHNIQKIRGIIPAGGGIEANAVLDNFYRLLG